MPHHPSGNNGSTRCRFLYAERQRKAFSIPFTGRDPEPFTFVNREKILAGENIGKTPLCEVILVEVIKSPLASVEDTGGGEP